MIHEAICMRKPIAAALIALVLVTALPIPALVQQEVFRLVNYSVKSSASTTEVYPGSKGVELVIEMLYNGSQAAEGVAACLELPEGFTPSRGYGVCSPAYSLNGSTVDVVEPGDVVAFKYMLDISEDVEPGNYTIDVKVMYRVAGVLYTEVHSGEVVIEVSEYPPIKLEVADVYWSGAAYPGTRGATLNIVLRNVGDSDIVSAHADVILYAPVEPTESRVDVGYVSSKSTVTISVTGIDIYADAEPGTYSGTIKLNATASTPDGVQYTGYATVNFTFTIDPAPPVKLEVLDFGWSDVRVVNGSTFAKLYVTFQSIDNSAVVRAATAKFKLLSGAEFTNGSTTCIVTYSGTVSYGDYLTLVSKDIVVKDNASKIVFTLELTIFGERGGSEFWTTLTYNFTVPVSKPSIDLYALRAYWAEGEVYPGSQSVTLVIDLANLDVVDVVDATAVLILPQQFKPHELAISSVTVSSGRVATLRFTGIDVGADAAPGRYIARLIVYGVASSGSSYYTFNVTLPVSIEVSSYGTIPLELVDYGWVDGVAYTTSSHAGVYVVLRVYEQVTVRSIVAIAKLPPQLIASNGRREIIVATDSIHGYGQLIRLEFTSINSTAAAPGTVSIVIVLNALCERGGAEFWVNDTIAVIALELLEPKLNYTLVDAGWAQPLVSGSSEGVAAYVTLQSFERGTASTVVVEAKFLGGVHRSDGENVVVWVGHGVGYGDVFTATFSDLEVETESSNVTAVLTVKAVVRVGNSLYIGYRTFNVTFRLVKSEETFVLSSLTTLYSGSPAPLLPSAKGVTLQFKLLNIRPEAVSSVSATPLLPDAFSVKEVYGTCEDGVAGGGVCTVNVVVDVSEGAAPGTYPVSLKLLYIKRIGSALVRMVQVLNSSVAVEDPRKYVPKIEVLEWFWGVTTPQTAFVGDREVPLTVVFRNYGRYPVHGVTAHISTDAPGVKILRDSELCTNVLYPGSTCSATFYVDLGEASAGAVTFKVVLEYLFREYGTHITEVEEFNITLHIDKYAAGQSVKPVSSGWVSDWPVYPNTENATYTVTLANTWPHAIGAVELRLHLPNGFFGSDGSNVVYTYVSGPIQSLQTFTASFTVTVTDVKPGTYPAVLKVTYVVLSGGAALRVEENYTVYLRVHSCDNAVEFVVSGWYGHSPEPEARGALFYIIFRNNHIPEMRGIVLELRLPRGFTCAVNNATEVRLPPYAVTTLPPQRISFEQVAKLIQQATYTSITASPGDFIVFVVPLNIWVNEPGTYTGYATLNFIDHWGNVRKLEFKTPITVLGSTKLLVVSVPKTISFVNGTAELPVTVVNRGSSPVYDVYIAIVPQAPLAIPVQNIKVINSIGSCRGVTVTYTLIYNPLGVMYGGISSQITYNTLPLIVTVTFRDVLGYIHTFNVTAAVMIEPFIDLRLSPDTKAVYEDGILSVHGVLLNYGLDTARNVELIISVGNASASSFIGDVDPGSQMAFRLELNVSSPPQEVTVVARYINTYGIEEVKKFSLKVIKAALKPKEHVEEVEQVPHIYYIATLIMIGVFLTLVGATIYKVLRKYMKRLHLGQQGG